MKIFAMVTGLILLTGSFAALAGEQDLSIGRVKNVSGHVVIEREGEQIPVTPGIRILPKDVIQTGDDGSLGMILKDNASMSMGENSRLAMTEFEFDPAVSRLKFVADMFKGTMTYLTGIIGKINPEVVKFRTPTATIGIRGTHLAIKVED